MEEATAALSKGFLRELFSTADPQPDGKTPIFQVIHFAEMNKEKSRWKIAFNDGEHAIQGMLTTQCSSLAVNGEIQVGGLVRLLDFSTSNLKGRWVLIVINLEVLSQYPPVAKIGNPTPVSAGSAEQQSAAPAPQAMSGQNFYGNAPKATSNASRPVASRPAASSHHGSIMPIDSISPYQSKWTIKARVTSKTPVKEWHNDRGQGKLFSFNLLDESGEIRATAFGNQCDAYSDMIEEGGVYYLSSPCAVKMAQRKFNNLNNDYELTLERDTVIEKAEDQQSVPQIRYNFTPIGDLNQVEKDAVVDTIGVLKEVGDVSQITSKSTGKPYAKRELTVVDDTDVAVRLTIWGNAAHDFNVPLEQVVAFKGAKVSDFNGRSLSLLSSGTMMPNPDVDEAFRLKGWYESQGRDTVFTSYDSLRVAGAGTSSSTPAKTLEQLKTEQIGMSSQAEYFDLKATTVYFSSANFSYPACPSPPSSNGKCNKKVTQDPDGSWRCDNCGFTAPEPQYRYVLNLSVSDHTGQCRMNCFDDVGQRIMGIPAKTMIEIKSDGGGDAERQAWLEATWNTYTLRCRAQMDTYQDEDRVRYTIVAANPVDFVKDSARLNELIKAYD